MPVADNLDDLEIISPDQQSDLEPVAEGSLLQKPFVPPPFTPQAFKIVGEPKGPPPTAGVIATKAFDALPPDLQGMLRQLPAASKALGSTTESVGDLAVGALADVGQNIVSPGEGYHTENVQTALNNPIIPTPAHKGPERLVLTPGKGFETIRHDIPAETVEELPTYADVRSAPGILRIPASAAQGLIKSAPQLALTAAGGEVLPMPLAAGAVFGSTKEGFDPKAAAVAAALPFAGKYSGEIAGAIAKQFGVEAPVALNWIKGVAGTTGPAAGLIADQEIEISKLPKDQQHEARVNMWANIAGQIALGPMGVEFERPGAPRGPERFPVNYREIQQAEPAKRQGPVRQPELPELKPGGPNAIQPEAAQPVRGVRAQPVADVGQVPPKEGGEAARSGGGEGQADEPRPQAGDVRSAPNEPIAQFVKDFTEGKTISTEKAVETGMSAKTIDDLDALAQLRLGVTEGKEKFLKDLEAEKDPAKRQKMFADRFKINPQIPREAIEAATNTGSHVEGEGKYPVRYGDRPLDWKKNPEVADWLRGNGEKLGITLPDELTKPQSAKQTVTADDYKRFGIPEPKQGMVRLYNGTFLSSGASGTWWTDNPHRASSFGNKVQYIDVTAEQAKAFKTAAQQKGQGGSSHFITDENLLKSGKDVPNPPMQAAHEIDIGKEGGVAGEETQKEGSKVLTPTPEPAMAGPGGTTSADVGTKPELAQLTDALKTMAEQSKGKPQLKQAYSLGQRLSQWKEPILKSVAGLKSAAQSAKITLTQPPKWNGYHNALGKRQLALSESVLNARDFMEKALKGVPSALDREAISNWVDNGGDRAKLLTAIAETDPRYEAGYQRALSLPPELRTVAENIRNYFESRLQDAIDAGILENGVEEYIHRTYEKDSPWKQGVISELRSGVFTGKPGLAKQRIFQYDYEAEKAGYKPEKDFSKRVAAYDVALNKAIADRQFVKELMEWKMPDGKPAIGVGGIGQKVGGVGTDAAFLVKPNFRGDKLATTDGRIYTPFDHPALRKWKWVEEDSEGTPILVQGEVYVHPDALKEIKAVFGQSAIRNFKLWGVPVGKLALSGSSIVKQTMLDLSGFHPVQITVHGWEHRADVPFSRWTAQVTGRTFKPIDLNDPVQRSLVSHGLNVVDYSGHELFSEGVSGGGSSLLRHVPYLGERLQQYNHWLFQDYIPRLKMEMATHALERNRRAYAKDLASGKMTEDQLLQLTSNQANAAFGELNYEMMGRNRTLQDALRLGLLAPDFLEARARFAGQAATSLVGGYGREQMTALGLGAATLYITARLINKMTDGEYHFEPEHAFDVMHNGRAYSLRTVQGDIIHAAFNPRSFAYTRLNPVTTRTMFEAMTGRDQFGRPRSAVDQLKDFASTIVPISGRGLLHPREQKLWESFLNAFGVTERRATASDSVFKLADDFKKKHGIQEPGEFIYDPEKDPYRGVKLALMFDTPETAAQEIKLALDKGATDWKHISAYFDQYGKKPFTGSKANEKVFWSTLSPDQQKLYESAIRERVKVRENARKAFQVFRQMEQNP